MPTREGSGHWKGTLKNGQGTVRSSSGALDADLTFGSRFENAAGTNPEELIAAAHAGCFSMALSMLLEQAGHPPEEIHTRAKVSIEKVDDGFAITGIKLQTRVTAPGLPEAAFREQTEAAKAGCPVSKALKAVPIELDAELAG